jgi:hypothetical protein
MMEEDAAGLQLLVGLSKRKEVDQVRSRSNNSDHSRLTGLLSAVHKVQQGRADQAAKWMAWWSAQPVVAYAMLCIRLCTASPWQSPISLSVIVKVDINAIT